MFFSNTLLNQWNLELLFFLKTAIFAINFLDFSLFYSKIYIEIVGQALPFTQQNYFMRKWLLTYGLFQYEDILLKYDNVDAIVDDMTSKCYLSPIEIICYSFSLKVNHNSISVVCILQEEFYEQLLLVSICQTKKSVKI